MNTKITLLLLLIFTTGIHTYTQSLGWSSSLGSVGYDSGYDLITDPAGNVYTTGYFSSALDFDPGSGDKTITPMGSADAFIMKQDATGNLVWVKTIGGTDHDQGNAIALDGAGNVYLTGTFEGTADLDPGVGVSNLTSNSTSDVFIMKLDAAGDFLWAQHIGGATYENAFAIASDNFGNVLIAGEFAGTVNFDPAGGMHNFTSAGLSDMYILKLDAAGSFLWARQTGGTENEVITSIDLDAAGNIYVAGSFNGTMDADPGAGSFILTSGGSTDLFISRLNASGDFVWAQNIGAAGEDVVTTITVDPSGYVYISGYFSNMVDFNSGAGTNNLSSAGYVDLFILKTDLDGNFVWAKQMGSSSYDVSNDHTIDNMGNIYLTGSFDGTVDFDPGPGIVNQTSSNDEVFVVKLSSAGNFLWVKQLMGDLGYDHGKSISADASGHVCILGNFQETLDVNPAPSHIQNLVSAGTRDIFIVRLDPCDINTNSPYTPILCYGNTSTVTVTATGGADPYLGIGTFTVNAGSYSYIVTDDNGCKDTSHISITEPAPVNTSTTVTGNTIMANLPGAAYQWMDCNTNSPVTIQTGQSYTPSNTGNYAVIITDTNHCTDTSACESISILGLEDKPIPEEQVSVFPNPTTGNFYIRTAMPVSITIVNALGEYMYATTIDAGDHPFNLGDYSPGLYFIHVQSSIGSSTYRIIIQK